MAIVVGSWKSPDGVMNRDRAVAVTGDGRAVAFEGWALVSLFGILAAVTWYQ